MLIQADAGHLPLRDETVDLTVFSPPYDKVRDYHGFTFDHLRVGHEIHRVTKPGGVCAVVTGDGTVDGARTLSSFSLAVDWCREAMWRMFADNIYSRHGKPGGWWAKRFRVDHEYLFFFVKGPNRPRVFDKTHLAVPSKTAGRTWNGSQRRTDGSLTPILDRVVATTKCRGTIWHYGASNTESKEVRAVKRGHPATFPDALASDIIRTFSLPGDTILDPCVGSGTTVAVAKQLGRVGIGSDLSLHYLQDVAAARLGC